MTKANEPAYPFQEVYTDKDGYAKAETISGLSKREKLAIEIYAREVDIAGTETGQEIVAIRSIRAADIFFEQLEKNGMGK